LNSTQDWTEAEVHWTLVCCALCLRTRTQVPQRRQVTSVNPP
jgi:hypothetical protein